MCVSGGGGGGGGGGEFIACIALLCTAREPWRTLSAAAVAARSRCIAPYRSRWRRDADVSKSRALKRAAVAGSGYG